MLLVQNITLPYEKYHMYYFKTINRILCNQVLDVSRSIIVIPYENYNLIFNF